MPAAYDKYDYPSYWGGRTYEHKSEIIAIKSMLDHIPKIHNILDIGAGYGRLTSSYLYRVKKAILADPSAKLLSIARENLKHIDYKKVTILQSTIENLPKKIKPHSLDAILMVRVIHHISDTEKAIKIVNKLLLSGGYFILEFANKKHFKATWTEILKGNITFPLDIFPKDIRSKKNIKRKTLPFINYHPDIIFKLLEDNDFEIIKKRSVSNFRNSYIKQLFPLDALIKIEDLLQEPLAYFNFGPSIFLLCKKR